MIRLHTFFQQVSITTPAAGPEIRIALRARTLILLKKELIHLSLEKSFGTRLETYGNGSRTITMLRKELIAMLQPTPGALHPGLTTALKAPILLKIAENMVVLVLATSTTGRAP